MLDEQAYLGRNTRPLDLARGLSRTATRSSSALAFAPPYSWAVPVPSVCLFPVFAQAAWISKTGCDPRSRLCGACLYLKSGP